MAVFYTAASLSGAFSGLLAFAIEKMDGVAGTYARTQFCLNETLMIVGRTGWQWMFVFFRAQSEPSCLTAELALFLRVSSLWRYHS